MEDSERCAKFMAGIRDERPLHARRLSRRADRATRDQPGRDSREDDREPADPDDRDRQIERVQGDVHVERTGLLALLSGGELPEHVRDDQSDDPTTNAADTAATRTAMPMTER